MTLNAILKTHAFLNGLSDEQHAKLAAVARAVDFEENELILRTGEQSDHFYLLVAGSVSIEVRSRAFTVAVQSLGPGSAFGWSALLDHHDTLFQVRAREHVRVIGFEGGELARVLATDAELAASMYRRALSLVAGRVLATERRLAEFCGLPLRDNLAPQWQSEIPGAGSGRSSPERVPASGGL